MDTVSVIQTEQGNNPSSIIACYYCEYLLLCWSVFIFSPLLHLNSENTELVNTASLFQKEEDAHFNCMVFA